MAKHERYSTYKDSASHWFGEIPSHWDLKPLKYLASINDEKLADSTDRDEVIEYVDIGNVTLQQGICGSETLSFEKAPSRARRIVRDGDSIVSTVRTYLKAIAPIKQPPPNLIVSTGFAVIRPRALDPGYLSYHLQSSNFVEDVVSRSVGVSYPAINPTEIAEIELLQPLLEEQQAISAWLDERTARIDTLIAKKQRLIELLQEKRQAIISKAVTRGLDPHVKLKDSGIPWLGEVPEHWEVKRLKHLLNMPLQYGANEAAEQDDEDQPRFIRITDIDGSGNLRQETFRSLPEEIARPFLLEDGDLLFARSGATVGKTFLYSNTWGRAAYAGYLIRARFNPMLVFSQFMHWYASSYQYWQWLHSNAIQATIQNVSADKYNNLWVPLPPIHEQRSILQTIQSELDRLDRLSIKAATALDHLKEYRSSLISAAVTGQIKVC